MDVAGAFNGGVAAELRMASRKGLAFDVTDGSADFDDEDIGFGLWMSCRMWFLMALVTWGMVWIVTPRYLPPLSALIRFAVYLAGGHSGSVR